MGTVKAVAVISGTDNVRGFIQHTQQTNGEGVNVSGRISGLSPGLHGFHIHALGDTTNGCNSTGPHFNPLKRDHGSPSDEHRHAGDLGNVVANSNGVAEISIMDKQLRNGEIMDTGASIPGSRQFNLKKSFKRSISSLLTISSEEEFRKAFPRCSDSEKVRLHNLFIQVLTSAHEYIEEDFESLCIKTQVGTVINHVDELAEERSLDPLPSTKSNIGEAAQMLSETRKTELIHLKCLLEKSAISKSFDEVTLSYFSQGKRTEAWTCCTCRTVQETKAGPL